MVQKKTINIRRKVMCACGTVVIDCRLSPLVEDNHK